jgi:DNA polymerase I-like protein with 3'-5' exonuclease and polymerase domains
MQGLAIKFVGKGFRVILPDNREEAELCVNQLKKIDPGTILGLDIETYPREGIVTHPEGPQGGLDPRLSNIRLIQIYDGGENIYVFDLKKINALLLKEILQTYKFAAHNAKFEKGHLFDLYKQDFNITCTLIMAQHVDLGSRPVDLDEDEEGNYKTYKGYSLAACCKRFLNEDLDKFFQTSDWGAPVLSNGQYAYSAYDALATQILFMQFYATLQAQGQLKSWSVSRAVMHAVREMQYEGIRIDARAHRELILSWHEELGKLKGDIDRYFFGINLNSPKQMAEWLLRTASPEVLSAWPKTKPSKTAPQGNYSFNTKLIAPFRGSPEINTLCSYKGVNKLITSFGETLLEKLHPVTKRLHPEYQEVSTLRFSASNPNVQQMPNTKPVRKLFIPAEGHKFVISDFSQIEMRVMAEVSRDANLLKIYREGMDVYSYMASLVFGIPYEKIEKESTERAIAKALMLGLGYGLGAKRFKETVVASPPYLSISEQQAYHYWNLYHTKMVPGYSKWCDEERRKCKARGYATNVLGGKRYLDTENSKEMYTVSVNNPIQSSAALVLKASMVYLFKALDGLGKIVACIHDEIIVECPAANADKCKLILEECMLKGWLYVFPQGITNKLAVAKVCDNWAEGK